MKTIVKAHGWTGFESVDELKIRIHYLTLALASMLYTLYRLRDEVFPVGHVVSLCFFLSEHNTDILLYIRYIQCSEDFPLHEQLLAAGRDYCTVPVD